MKIQKYVYMNEPSEELTDWITEQFDLLDEEVDYVDNRRWYEVGDASGESKFREQEENGCCGSLTREIVHPTNGKMYVFGLNHGH